MAKNTGKTVATLLVGTAVGAAIGYLLGTDKDQRDEQIEKLRDSVSKLKERAGKKTRDLEEEIFNS